MTITCAVIARSSFDARLAGDIDAHKTEGV